MLATLLPDVWFKDQNTLVLLLITAVTMAAVIKGADWLVDGAAGLAARLGMSKVIIGATIVSLGTTTPEMAVSVLAAWAGNAGLALGNGVGSIIADTGLIFGVGCLIAVLPADRFVLNRQGWVQFGAAVLLSVICYGLFAVHGDAAKVTRPIGFVMLALLVVYMIVSVRWAKLHPRGEPHSEGDPHLEITEAQRPVIALLALGVIGVAMVVTAGDGLVQSVSLLALRWGVPNVVVAATLVAFGTSLPELVVGMTAIRKGHPELLVGNVIGADILNVLFVIGAAAAAKPLPIIEAGATRPAIFLQLHLPTMLLMLAMFRVFIFRAVRRGEFSRWMGWPLLLLYVVYIILQFALTAGHGAG